MSSTIAIWGGTFDPPHRGHLAMMKGMADALNVDTLRLMPAHIPPHKTASAAVRHRKAMVELLCAEDSRFLFDDRELTSPDMSYTVRSCQHLRDEFPDDTLIFGMGGDSFQAFHQWYQWQDIVKLVDIAVVDRPRYNVSNTFVESYVKSHQMGEDKIRRLHLPLVDISSTQIRQMYASASTQVSQWLTKPIQHYIEENKLYI